MAANQVNRNELLNYLCYIQSESFPEKYGIICWCFVSNFISGDIYYGIFFILVNLIIFISMITIQVLLLKLLFAITFQYITSYS